MPTPNESTERIDQKSLPDALRADLASAPENSRPYTLYLLIDMGRLPDELRPEVLEKLKAFKFFSLVKDARDKRYEGLEAHGPLLVADSANNANNVKPLLEAWGECNSNIVSAWITSNVRADILATHLRRARFAVDANDKHYLLRWYDPLITPVLHRLAEKEWVRMLLFPILGWWYPIATPTEETWHRIGGDAHMTIHRIMPPLRMTEELWAALESDPFPYQLLSFVEEKLPSVFDADCYGVRLAKIEELLDVGKKQGLSTRNDDLTVYVLALLEEPARATEPRWQAALNAAVAGFTPLKTYFAG